MKEKKIACNMSQEERKRINYNEGRISIRKKIACNICHRKRERG